MSWTVLFHDEFDREFQGLAKGLQDELLAHALLLEEFGPTLGRPTVDTHLASLAATAIRKDERHAKKS